MSSTPKMQGFVRQAPFSARSYGAQKLLSNALFRFGDQMADTYSRVAFPTDQEFTKIWLPDFSRTDGLAPAQDNESIFPEKFFQPMLTMERQRAQRSRKPFVLMLIDAGSQNGKAAGILKRAAKVVQSTMRETDLVGWHKDSAVLGVIFTEINMRAKNSVTETLRLKFETAISKQIAPLAASNVFVSLHVFPETWEQDVVDQSADAICVGSRS
jgi:hypothetical protein